MRRALAGAVLLALALGAGSARGDTFTIVTSSSLATVAAIPSAEAPNPSGSLLLPANWTLSAGPEKPISNAELSSLWHSAGAAYGIPWSVLAAINKVESNFGRNMGPSSAGAIGWMQFMPGTWLSWGGDYDGDGVADPWDATDAVYSAARYLAAAGGGADISGAVFSYNHADWYVNEVLSLAQLFDGNASLSFSLDELQQSLEKAERQVASLNQQIADTRTRANAIDRRARRMLASADRLELIDQRSAARMRAARVEAEALSVRGGLPDLTAQLANAKSDLAQARSNSIAQSFDPATSVYLSSPLYQNGYVFPVGGGPSLVSVAHTHHDYPAADIAAPAGSPEYALADGVVLRAWQGIDPLCGIGMDFRTDDGQTWAYCHMSYREPTVVAGARLTAGELVGLVGSTGHATGPHLHLGLIPSSRGYPQDEAWFQSFAGIAFRWQDAQTPSYTQATAALQSPVVFDIVGGGLTGADASEFTVSSQTVLPSVAPSSRSGSGSLFAADPQASGDSSEQGSTIEFSR
jgi:murein DD-endopeptidase MepM/ murein hydrolase activator NlpD